MIIRTSYEWLKAQIGYTCVRITVICNSWLKFDWACERITIYNTLSSSQITLVLFEAKLHGMRGKIQPERKFQASRWIVKMHALNGFRWNKTKPFNEVTVSSSNISIYEIQNFRAQNNGSGISCDSDLNSWSYFELHIFTHVLWWCALRHYNGFQLKFALFIQCSLNVSSSTCRSLFDNDKLLHTSQLENDMHNFAAKIF